MNIVKVSQAFTTEVSVTLELLFDEPLPRHPFDSDPLIWLPAFEWYLGAKSRTYELVRQELEKLNRRNFQEGVLLTDWFPIRDSHAELILFSNFWNSDFESSHKLPLSFFGVSSRPPQTNQLPFRVDGLYPVYLFLSLELEPPPNLNLSREELHADVLTFVMAQNPPEYLNRYFDRFGKYLFENRRRLLDPDALNNFNMEKESWHLFGLPPDPYHGIYRRFPDHLEEVFQGVLEKHHSHAQWLVFADALQETYEDAEANANFIRCLHTEPAFY